MHTAARQFILLITVLFMYTTGTAQQSAQKIIYPGSPDGIIGFLEFRPADYENGLHPLIIFLHGWDERGNGSSQLQSVANSGIPRYCASGASMKFRCKGQPFSFIVLSPQLSKQYGAWPVYYVKEMIQYAKANLRIDTNRIYITGLSLGGGGTWAAITESPELTRTIAAAAPVCGTQDMKDAAFCVTVAAAHLPVWAFHAMDDKTVFVNATQHAEALAGNCRLEPAMKITYYKEGGHPRAWINAYDTGHITATLKDGILFKASPNLYEWFLEKTAGGNRAGK